jgi:hypothetical protein
MLIVLLAGQFMALLDVKVTLVNLGLCCADWPALLLG